MSCLVGKCTTFTARKTPARKTVAHLPCREQLIHFPSRLVYVAGCRCWKLQKYVDLNPGGREIKGTLNHADDWTLNQQFTEIGEALVAKDGLIHPDNPFHWPIRFYRMCLDLAMYLRDFNPDRPGFPVDYKAPEQQHVWEIPEGTPLPEDLHLSRPKVFGTVDPDISDAYHLELSKPMELNGLSGAFQTMLTKYGHATPVEAWLSRPENEIMECYSKRYSKELVPKWGVPPEPLYY